VVKFESLDPEIRGVLGKKVSELGLRVEGSPVEGYVRQLYQELDRRGLKTFRPVCYLTDEWGCPDQQPVLGIPFYLADPKLRGAPGGDATRGGRRCRSCGTSSELPGRSPMSSRSSTPGKWTSRPTYWTGVQRPIVRGLIDSVCDTCERMKLWGERGEEARYLVEVTALTTTLAMNCLTSGRFET